MAPVPKDDPDRVHMYALFFVTIVFFHGVKILTQSTSSSPTYMKLHNGSEDRQKLCVPSFSISYFPSGPVQHAVYTYDLNTDHR